MAKKYKNNHHQHHHNSKYTKLKEEDLVNNEDFKDKSDELIFLIAMCMAIIIFLLSIDLGGFIIKNTYDNNYTNIEPIIKTNIEKVITSDTERFGLLATYYKSCSNIEAGAEASGISNIKKKVCTEICGRIDKYYVSNSYEKDLLVCYCK